MDLTINSNIAKSNQRSNSRFGQNDHEIKQGAPIKIKVLGNSIVKKKQSELTQSQIGSLKAMSGSKSGMKAGPVKAKLLIKRTDIKLKDTE